MTTPSPTAEPPRKARWEGTATVLGPAVTMGSKRALPHRSSGRIILIDDKSPALRNWQQAMREKMQASAPEAPLAGPVSLSVLIYLQRPKGHYGSGKNAQVLKPTAPGYPTGKPDADKIARAVLDCGTGIWFRDDAQVIGLHVMKRWAGKKPPRVVVDATEMPLGGDSAWWKEQG